jgi:hypothetical protein
MFDRLVPLQTPAGFRSNRTPVEHDAGRGSGHYPQAVAERVLEDSVTPVCDTA